MGADYEGVLGRLRSEVLIKKFAKKFLDDGSFRSLKDNLVQKNGEEAKKKQKVISVKEVKLRPGIETHDFNFKVKNAMRFIAEGNKVKATIMFRGRELSHPEMGKELLLKVAEAMQDAVTVEREPKLEGKNMIMILAPKVQTKGGNTNAKN